MEIGNGSQITREQRYAMCNAVIGQVEEGCMRHRHLWLTNHLGEEDIGMWERSNGPRCLDHLILLTYNCMRWVFRKPWISIHPHDVANRLVTCFEGVEREGFLQVSLIFPDQLDDFLGNLEFLMTRSRPFNNHSDLKSLIERLRPHRALSIRFRENHFIRYTRRHSPISIPTASNYRKH